MSRYEFPWPPRELSPNARVHWRALARVKAQYKEDCEWAICAQPPPDWTTMMFPLNPPIQAQVTFEVADRRRRDSDNHMTMLKLMWDALVEMGVLEDDSYEKLRIAEPKWERGSEKKVIVELSPYRDGGE